ncbi:MAG: hypothetical protein AWU57_559 [Marinobacter sp. T13-3]|nr:MAG: hypothetical protein AWU57_559 [Marinobacter sp. T13-3]
MSRTLNIVTKAEATRILNATPGARRFPYCTGKYAWSGSAKDYLGRPVENAPDDVKAVYVERRQDQDGPYAKMMSITTW